MYNHNGYWKVGVLYYVVVAGITHRVQASRIACLEMLRMGAV